MMVKVYHPRVLALMGASSEERSLWCEDKVLMGLEAHIGLAAQNPRRKAKNGAEQPES